MLSLMFAALNRLRHSVAPPAMAQQPNFSEDHSVSPTCLLFRLHQSGSGGIAHQARTSSSPPCDDPGPTFKGAGGSGVI